MNQLTADEVLISECLTQFYGHADGLLSICSDADRWAGRRFPTDADGITAATKYALHLDTKRATGVYVQATTLRENPSEGRGGESLVYGLTHMWADGDFGTIGHKPSLDDLPHPTDEDQVRAIVDASGLPAPTGWVHTGGGLNPMWMLDQSRNVTDDETRQHAKHLTTTWQTILGAAAYRAGCCWDTEVGNLDRLMRLPGSVNRKEGQERPTSVILGSGNLYELAELHALAEQLGPDATAVMAQAQEEKRQRKAARLGKPVPPPRAAGGSTVPRQHSGDGPLDVLADTLTFRDILEPAGFTYTGQHSDGREKWLRPAGANGSASSAYSLLCNDHVAINWSERADLPVGAQAPGNKLTIGTLYAHLNYGGDVREAARDIVRAAAGHGHGPATTLPVAVRTEVQRRCMTDRHGFEDLMPTDRTAPPKNDSSNSSEAPQGPRNGFSGIAGMENEGGGAIWEPPIPVPTYRLPPFPTDALGAPLAAWVRAQSVSLNVSEDLVAFSALGTVSTALGGRRRIHVKDGWEDENVCLYLLGLAGSSARKTPALDAASAALREQTAQLREDRRAEVDENDQKIRIAEAEMVTAERLVAQGKGSPEDARAVLDTLRELRDKPGLPKTLVGDVTLEALGKLMGENGGRMGLLESEAGFFKACAGLYGNGRADITLVLKAYSGTGHDIERIMRGSTWMPHTALSIALIVQPGVVEQMEKDNPEFKSSGFLNRFLYSLPAPMPPGTFDTPAVPAAIRDDYNQRIGTLFQKVWTAENITTVHLTHDARKRFADFYNEVEQRKAENGDLHDLAEWAGKLCGQLLRVAACLTLFDDHGATEINEEGMGRALSLAPYLVTHARAAFALMSRDGDGGRKLLRDILDRLRDLADNEGTVTLRKVRESFKGRLATGGGNVDAEAIQEAMEQLEDLGWVAEILAPPRRPGQRGARPSPRYDIHPQILTPPSKETS